MWYSISSEGRICCVLLMQNLGQTTGSRNEFAIFSSIQLISFGGGTEKKQIRRLLRLRDSENFVQMHSIKFLKMSRQVRPHLETQF